MGKKSRSYGSSLNAASAAQVAAPAPTALISRFLAASQQAAPLATQEVPGWNEVEVLDLVEQVVPESRARFQGFLERFAALGGQLKEAHNRLEVVQRSAEDVKAKHEEALVALETERMQLIQQQASLEERASTLKEDSDALTARAALVVAQEREVIAREVERMRPANTY